MIYLALPYNNLVVLMVSSPFQSIATCFSIYTLKLPFFKSVSSVRTGEKPIIFWTLETEGGCDPFRSTQAAAFQNSLRKWGDTSGWGCTICPKYIRSKKTMNHCSVIATLNPRERSLYKDKLTRERAGRNTTRSILKKTLSFDKPLEEEICRTSRYQRNSEAV